MWDEIIDLVKTDAMTEELEFEEVLQADVLMVVKPPAPEIQDALRARGCKLKSDDAGRTLIVMPLGKRMEERVLNFWNVVSLINLVFLVIAFGVYLYSGWQNKIWGF